MMNLLMAPMNVKLEIIRIKKGRGIGKKDGNCLGSGSMDGRGHMDSNDAEKDNQDRHLANLGFVLGADIMVVAESEGNLIVKVKDSRVGIGNDIARKIMVQEKSV